MQQDIAKITQASLRKNISLVPQDPILFHRTLRENIAYGKPDATLQEIEHAAKLAHAYEFIRDLPQKYETLVGERGVKLSGGERQRVAIARAILANTPVIILDEATSSLDSHSESLIQEALKNLLKNRTAIIIAHRLSTIKSVDRILVFNKGRIVEQGTHKALVRKEGGLYRKLYEMQVGGFLADDDEIARTKEQQVELHIIESPVPENGNTGSQMGV
ncbi:MAG: ATP-binding cassette domain-containing protein [Candidatus Gracilibacteria bacterium]